MLQSWDIVAICCLVFFGVAYGSITIWFCLRPAVRRRRRLQRSKPQVPVSKQDVLAQLYGVTEKQTVRDYRLRNDRSECPICLSTFSRRSEDGLEQQSHSDDDRIIQEIDIEAGTRVTKIKGSMTRDPRGSTTLGSTPEERKRTLSPPQPVIDIDILKIRRCGHAFHKQCLANWFQKGQYDCPICRVTYYPPRSDSPDCSVSDPVVATTSSPV